MIQELEKFGISKNEAKIYLLLLKRGSSKVNEIYEETKIQRTFIYEILNTLLEKGLVSYVIKSGVKFFEASSPEKIREILVESEMIKTLDKEIESFRNIFGYDIYEADKYISIHKNKVI